MKSLTLEAYKLLYYLTGAEKLSYYAAMLILAVLHVIFLMGMAMLLDGVVKTKELLFLFSFPYNIAVGLVVFGINRVLVTPKLIEVAHNIHVRYAKLLVYFVLALLILAYKFFLK